MAIVKAISSKSGIGSAIKYITSEEKTEEHLISGIDCNPKTAIEEMKLTKEIWNKTGGRQYQHYVHSFPPADKLTHEEAHKMTIELFKDRFKGHAIVIATHKDTEHIHSHIIINSVNHETGYKFQQSKQDLRLIKKHCNELSQNRGLSVPEKSDEFTTYDMKKYKAIERGITSDYKSYIHNCYKSVMEVKDQAINKDDFISKMKEKGFETNWSDNRKHITFTDIARKKQGKTKCKVRNSKLEKDYKDPLGKEILKNGFESNNESQRADRTGNTEAQIKINNRRITDAKLDLSNARITITDTRNTVNDFDSKLNNSRIAIKIDDSKGADRNAHKPSVNSKQDRIREQRTVKVNTKRSSHER